MSGGRDPEAEVRRWLSGQGYALEHVTAEGFRQAGYVASLGRTYRDATTAKTREIDVVASFRQTYLRAEPPFETLVAVECKVAPVPWVVRKAELLDEQLTWRAVATASVADFISQANQIARFPLGDPPGFDVVAARTTQKPAEDPAFGAIAQAVMSARGLVEAAGRERPVLVHPVVVVDGHLFSLSYDADGRDQVRPTTSERIVWSGDSSTQEPVVVDIVTRPAIQTFAKSLRQIFLVLQNAAPDRSFVRSPVNSF
jgi:hypothetical protein